jgi:dTDP-4-amino-4,6-dideoxygalactose transaminase
MDADLALVSRTVHSGWFVLGSQVKAFEAEFAAYLGARDAVGVGNGTDALMLAMRAVGVEPGDRVVMAANAGMYSAAAAVAVGAVPEWVDVLPSRGSLDPAALADHVAQSKPAAVVVTHLYGLMAEVEQISQICQAAGVPLIEDCAQAAGASVGGRFAGTWGDCATFSFYPTKNLAAWGDAGAVVSNSEAIVDRVRRLHQYGWTSRYRAEIPYGVNSRMDEIQATVLRARLTRLDEGNQRRRSIMSRYVAAAPQGVRAFFEDSTACVAHLSVLVFGSEQERDNARTALDAANVATDVHYPIPDYRQPAMAAYSAGVDLPTTQDLARRVLTIPCFPGLTDVEVDQVCLALSSLQAEV